MEFEEHARLMSEYHVVRRAESMLSYILDHMIDPPKTLKVLALDLQSALIEFKKRHKEEK